MRTFNQIGMTFIALGTALLIAGAPAEKQPLPCEQQAGRLAQTAEPPLALPIPGVVDQATAESNLRWWESQKGDVILPEGTFWFSRAPRITRSGQRIRGAGMNRTKIKNAYCYSPFGDNCSLQIHTGVDVGHGYADGMKQVVGEKRAEFALTLNDPSVAINYPVGTLCWTWKWDGYADGWETGNFGNTRCRVHRVTAARGPTLTLDSQPDPQANAVNWSRGGVRIAPAAEGTLVVTATEPTALFAVGTRVWLTEGPTVANETIGEYRVIAAVAGSKFTLDRPLRWGYGSMASMIVYTPVADVTISDLTIGASPHPQGAANYFQSCVGLTLDRVAVDGDIQITLAAEVRVRDCRPTGTVFFNATRDADVSGCLARHNYFEERCSDIDIRNCRFSGAALGGITSNFYAPSERLRFRDVVVEASHDSPINVSGRECMLDNVRTQGSQNPVSWVFSYFNGDRSVVRGFHGDLALVIQSGRGVELSGVQTQMVLGWPNITPPVGTAVQCSSVNDTFLPAAVKNQWSFAAVANSSAVSSVSIPPKDRKPMLIRNAVPTPASIR